MLLQDTPFSQIVHASTKRRKNSFKINLSSCLKLKMDKISTSINTTNWCKLWSTTTQEPPGQFCNVNHQSLTDNHGKILNKAHRNWIQTHKGIETQSKFYTFDAHTKFYRRRHWLSLLNSTYVQVHFIPKIILLKFWNSSPWSGSLKNLVIIEFDYRYWISTWFLSTQ